jgi:signal transduction histidine kinase
VADSGKGMSPEQLGQVFVPFFTTKPRGTGLGLTLAQRILNEHGAQLECASTIGHGTSFTIRLPLKEAA